MSESHPILVPREIMNADSIIVIEWLLPNGSGVDLGAALCDIETSKAIVTVRAEHSGFLRHVAAVDQEVPVGGVLGYVTAALDTPLPLREGLPATQPDSGTRMSAKASHLIRELRLDEALFKGMGLVRERDVLQMAEKTGAAKEQKVNQYAVPSHEETLSPIQRRVAQVLDQSVSRPISYMEVVVALEKVSECAKAATANAKVLVSPLDLLVSAVAKASQESPRFNSYLASEDRLNVYDLVNVGVAVDVEGDLFVVTVREAGSKTASEVARELRQLQYLAQKKRLGVRELTGGTITVTSMLGKGIVRFLPLLYPRQAAIIGISDANPKTGEATLCLGFDHRVANGGLAAAFLKRIRNLLVSEGT